MRRTEVYTGLLITLVCFSFMAALLLDFKFVSPLASPQEDLAYLSESIESQRNSAILWFATALLTALTIPAFLKTMNGLQHGIQYLNAAFMIIASGFFLLMALNGLALYRDIMSIIPDGLDHIGEHTRISILNHFHKEQWFRYFGSTFVGLWAIGLGLSRIRVRRIPLHASVLLIMCGPVLIFFNWYDPDHLARTGAMAGIITGVLIFSFRLVNKGIRPRVKSGDTANDNKADA